MDAPNEAVRGWLRALKAGTGNPDATKDTALRAWELIIRAQTRAVQVVLARRFPDLPPDELIDLAGEIALAVRRA